MILLVHHGDALGPDVDAMRPLSALGQAAATRLAGDAAARGVRPDVILHSGKLRARQTAELFWRLCNPLAEFSAARGLQPGDAPRSMRDDLAADDRSLVIVGHMPHLPRLLALLRGDADTAAPEFPLHGCVALEREGNNWKEMWRLTTP